MNEEISIEIKKNMDESVKLFNFYPKNLVTLKLRFNPNKNHLRTVSMHPKENGGLGIEWGSRIEAKHNFPVPSKLYNFHSKHFFCS